MLPSEELRQTISAKYNIDLKQFAWPTKLKEQILSIVLDKALETQWNPDRVYLAYQKQLSPDKFKQEYLQIYSELIK